MDIKSIDSQKRILDNSVTMVMMAMAKANTNPRLALEMLKKANERLTQKVLKVAA